MTIPIHADGLLQTTHIPPTLVIGKTGEYFPEYPIIVDQFRSPIDLRTLLCSPKEYPEVLTTEEVESLQRIKTILGIGEVAFATEAIPVAAAINEANADWKASHTLKSVQGKTYGVVTCEDIRVEIHFAVAADGIFQTVARLVVMDRNTKSTIGLVDFELMVGFPRSDDITFKELLRRDLLRIYLFYDTGYESYDSLLRCTHIDRDKVERCIITKDGAVVSHFNPNSGTLLTI